MYHVYVIERINEIDYIKKPKPDDVEGSYVTFNPLVRKHDSDILIYNRITSPHSYRFIALFFRCVTRYALILWCHFSESFFLPPMSRNNDFRQI